MDSRALLIVDTHNIISCEMARCNAGSRTVMSALRSAHAIHGSGTSGAATRSGGGKGFSASAAKEASKKSLYTCASGVLGARAGAGHSCSWPARARGPRAWPRTGARDGRRTDTIVVYLVGRVCVLARKLLLVARDEAQIRSAVESAAKKSAGGVHGSCTAHGSSAEAQIVRSAVNNAEAARGLAICGARSGEGRATARERSGVARPGAGARRGGTRQSATMRSAGRN